MNWLVNAVTSTGSLLAAFVAFWAWTDRPRYWWRVKTDLQHRPTQSSRRQDVSVSPIGTGVAFDIHVRTRGLGQIGQPEGLDQPMMVPGQDSIVFTTGNPAVQSEESWIEIAWTTPREQRTYGARVRVDVKPTQWEEWRWLWCSVRWRKGRFRRTKGTWVAKRHEREPIP